MIKRYIESYAKYGGIVAVSFEWLAILIFYIQKPSDFSGQHPISYFATLPQTRIVFSICYTLAAICFWVFAKYHLNKHYRTPTKLFTLSMLGFAGVALVPFNPAVTISYITHSTLAELFFATFLAGMYSMAKNNDDKLLRFVSTAAVILSGLLLTAFLFTHEGSQFVLVLEASGGFICQLWIVWMSYHSYKK